ncbi:MAG: tetratricopeptide repeat protein [Deltaproteobacteria bacterium]|nr:tetratricopeptide repeat protein [Deltaproteobacteria bacterium]MBN2674663.1 tetratricopeptide repeat protein [Deltaproteobacteria bacterium]
MKKAHFLLIAVSAIGCTPAPHTNGTAPIRPLPPIHVVATPDSQNGMALDAFDAAELFSRAAANQREGNCDEAVVWYRKLQTEFPDAEELEPGYYNMGLCLNQLERHNEAAAAYRSLITAFPNSPDKQNAYFRLASSLEELEAWNEMVSTFNELQEQSEPLTALDEVEIYAKTGAALMRMSQPAQARIALENAVRIFTRDERISATAPDYYYSMAQFKLAELTHEEMRQVALPPDDTELAAILEKKCRLLLDSQYLYTKVIRIGHPHWSAAAAYRTGALYHHLWKDMLAAPAPAGLTEEEQGIYMEVLRKRIKVLLQKAVKQWKRTIAFAKRLELDNAWVLQTETDLREIEAVLEIEETIGADLPIN